MRRGGGIGNEVPGASGLCVCLCVCVCVSVFVCTSGCVCATFMSVYLRLLPKSTALKRHSSV